MGGTPHPDLCERRRRQRRSSAATTVDDSKLQYSSDASSVSSDAECEATAKNHDDSEQKQQASTPHDTTFVAVRKVGRPRGHKTGTGEKTSTQSPQRLELVHYTKLTSEELFARTQQLPPGLELYDTCRTPRVLKPAEKRALLDQTMRLSETGLTEDLSCPICMGTYQNVAVVKDCLHRFCEQCIERWLRTGHQDCPKCRQRIPSRRSLRADPIFERIVRRLFPDVARYEELNDRAVAQVNHRKIGLPLKSTCSGSKWGNNSPEHQGVKRRRRSCRVSHQLYERCAPKSHAPRVQKERDLETARIIAVNPTTAALSSPFAHFFQAGNHVEVKNCVTIRAVREKILTEIENTYGTLDAEPDYLVLALTEDGLPLRADQQLITLPRSNDDCCLSLFLRYEAPETKS